MRNRVLCEKKRGQISYFMILAVGIILVLGLVIALRNPFVRDSNVAEFPPKIEPVVDFVQKCLAISTANGLRLLGLQGGVIYESQGGTIPDSFVTEDFATVYNERWVWHSIFVGGVVFGLSCSPRDIASGTYSYERCPSITFPYEDENSDRIIFGTDAGSPKAHDISGNLVSNMLMSNQLNLPGLYENEGIARRVEWTQSLLSPRMKIRSDLAEFIKNNITKCLNFEELRRVNGLVITRAGNISVNPTFSEEYTKVELEFPLKVVNNRSNLAVFIDKFSIESSVRFGKIYKYVNDILRKESEDYSYNLSSTLPSDGIALASIYRDVGEKKVDIVVFEDNKSSLPKQHMVEYETYSFLAAIPNSPPAASYIHYRNLSAVPGLKSYIMSKCGDVFVTPQNILSARVFKTVNRETIACLFDAYKNSTELQGSFRPAYDPDDDAIGWDFQTSDCAWGQPCEYDNESEFDRGMNTFLRIKFFEIDNTSFNDSLVIPIKLFDYPPTDVNVFCTGVDIASGWYLYRVEANNMEDPHKDALDLALTFNGAPIEFILGSRTSTGYQTWWPIWFKNETGTFNITFTVTDSFGAANSSNTQVVIPC